MYSMDEVQSQFCSRWQWYTLISNCPPSHVGVEGRQIQRKLPTFRPKFQRKQTKETNSNKNPHMKTNFGPPASISNRFTNSPKSLSCKRRTNNSIYFKIQSVLVIYLPKWGNISIYLPIGSKTSECNRRNLTLMIWEIKPRTRWRWRQKKTGYKSHCRIELKSIQFRSPSRKTGVNSR